MDYVRDNERSKSKVFNKTNIYAPVTDKWDSRSHVRYLWNVLVRSQSRVKKQNHCVVICTAIYSCPCQCFCPGFFTVAFAVFSQTSTDKSNWLLIVERLHWEPEQLSRELERWEQQKTQEGVNKFKAKIEKVRRAVPAAVHVTVAV